MQGPGSIFPPGRSYWVLLRTLSTWDFMYESWCLVWVCMDLSILESLCTSLDVLILYKDFESMGPITSDLYGCVLWVWSPKMFMPKPKMCHVERIIRITELATRKRTTYGIKKEDNHDGWCWFEQMGLQDQRFFGIITGYNLYTESAGLDETCQTLMCTKSNVTGSNLGPALQKNQRAYRAYPIQILTRNSTNKYVTVHS